MSMPTRPYYSRTPTFSGGAETRWRLFVTRLTSWMCGWITKAFCEQRVTCGSETCIRAVSKHCTILTYFIIRDYNWKSTLTPMKRSLGSILLLVFFQPWNSLHHFSTGFDGTFCEYASWKCSSQHASCTRKSNPCANWKDSMSISWSVYRAWSRWHSKRGPRLFFLMHEIREVLELRLKNVPKWYEIDYVNGGRTRYVYTASIIIFS